MSEAIDINDFIEVLGQIFPDANFSVKERTDGPGHIVYGPFPTVMFLLGSETDPDGYMVSVNADPSLMVLVMTRLLKHYPHLVHFGPYCEDIDGNGVHLDPEAIKKQHTLHMLRRAMLVSMEQNQGAEADAVEKKIIVPNQELVIAR